MEPKLLGKAIREARERRNWSQEHVAALADTSQSVVGRVEAGDFKRLSEAIQSIARVLGVPTRAGVIITNDLGDILAEPPPSGGSKMDVLGIAQGGAGELILDNEPIDRVERPTELLDVRGAYALQVSGTSMVPAFRPGEIVLVHPFLNPVAEDDVVLQSDVNGARSAMIKNFLGSTEKEWRLQQWNQAKKFSVRKADWPRCHVIVGKYRRR